MVGLSGAGPSQVSVCRRKKTWRIDGLARWWSCMGMQHKFVRMFCAWWPPRLNIFETKQSWPTHGVEDINERQKKPNCTFLFSFFLVSLLTHSLTPFIHSLALFALVIIIESTRPLRRSSPPFSIFLSPPPHSTPHLRPPHPLYLVWVRKGTELTSKSHQCECRY